MSVAVHFSSATDEWPTPEDFFALLDVEFEFDIDLCAADENALCSSFYTKADDALKKDWWRDGTKGFCNPPYGRCAGGIGAFLAKGREAATNGMTAVFLIPARPDTKWWHQHVMQADEVRLIAGRLKFGDGSGNAPFPSCIVVYRPARTFTAGNIVYTLTPTVKPVFSCLTRTVLP